MFGYLTTSSTLHQLNLCNLCLLRIPLRHRVIKRCIFCSWESLFYHHFLCCLKQHSAPFQVKMVIQFEEVIWSDCGPFCVMKSALSIVAFSQQGHISTMQKCCTYNSAQIFKLYKWVQHCTDFHRFCNVHPGTLQKEREPCYIDGTIFIIMYREYNKDTGRITKSTFGRLTRDFSHLLRMPQPHQGWCSYSIPSHWRSPAATSGSLVYVLIRRRAPPRRF